jgi:hypothetical protein
VGDGTAFAAQIGGEVIVADPNSAAIKKITAAPRSSVNSSNNWPKSALTLVNNELSDGPDKAAIALADASQFGADGLDITHARSLGPCGGDGSSPFNRLGKKGNGGLCQRRHRGNRPQPFLNPAGPVHTKG